MRVRTWINTVRLGHAEYRVIQPARPLVRAALYAEPHGVPAEPDSLAMFVGRAEAVVLTALWGLATCSPRSLVYLPMRHTSPPQGLPCGPVPQVSLDLVLVHHSLQLPASRWKEIRSRLAAGSPHTASVQPSAFAEVPVKNEGYAAKDPLRIGFAANTAIITGSALGFRAEGHLLREMITEAGRYLKETGGKHHYCVELGDRSGNRRHRPLPTQVHIQYSPRWQV